MPGWLDANMKVQYDNLVSHSKMVDSYQELALKQAIENQDLIVKEFLKHSADRDSMTLENQRYLLDWLTSMYPPEAAGMGTYMTMLINALKKDQSFAQAVAEKLKQQGTQ